MAQALVKAWTAFTTISTAELELGALSILSFVACLTGQKACLNILHSPQKEDFLNGSRSFKTM